SSRVCLPHYRYRENSEALYSNGFGTSRSTTCCSSARRLESASLLLSIPKGSRLES
ncbi:hypothetical protein PanWU01x14_344720, partial [Parasponia andersonii]